MMKFLTAALLPLVLLAGCHAGTTERALDLTITVEKDDHSAALTCRTSTSGTCVVAFILPDGAQTLEAKVGTTARTGGIALPERYCAGPETPDPATCHARPLDAGEQIYRMRVTKSG